MRLCEQASGALQNFLASFWKKHAVQPDEVAASLVASWWVPVELRVFSLLAQEPEVLNDVDLQKGLDSYFGGKKKKVEDVDMGARLEQACLSQHFCHEIWPASAAVRELATQLKSRSGFVFSDLRK